MKERAELKALQVKKTELATKHASMRQALSTLQAQLKTLSGDCDFVDREIRRLVKRSTQPIVSEHAIIRYCERVIGIDLDEIREKILPSGMAMTVAKLQNGKFPVGASHTLVVNEGIVATVLTNGDE